MREIIFGDKEQYKANENGEIFTCSIIGSHSGKTGKTWRRIVPSVSRGGYEFFRMNGRRGTNKYIHRIVAELFIGVAPFEKADVNHKNCVKTDNRVANLEWVTRRENAIHARENGLLKPPRGLTMEQVKTIKRLLGEKKRPVDIHRETGLPLHSIYSINEGKLYKRDF